MYFIDKVMKFARIEIRDIYSNVTSINHYNNITELKKFLNKLEERLDKEKKLNYKYLNVSEKLK